LEKALNHRISVVGCGPGSPDYITPAAHKAVAESDVLIGASRLLDVFTESTAERVAVTANIEDVLERIRSIPVEKRVAVLVTGDPGIFSLAKKIVENFGRKECRIIPGVSSVQAAFAAIGLDWADAAIISAHKQDPEDIPSMDCWDKIAILGGRDNSLKWIASHLPEDTVSERRIFLCENLTLHEECIREINPEELVGLRTSSRTVVIVVKKGLLS
jgi:cobalt-precorrin-7 (C5)-methyltransferase